MLINDTKQTNKKTKVASYSNWQRVLLFDSAHKQHSGVVKRWHHCLMSESKGRFLANNIFLAWCLIMVQIQFSLIKKERLESRTLANTSPHPTQSPALITSHFYSTHPLPRMGRHMYITPFTNLLLKTIKMQNSQKQEFMKCKEKNLWNAKARIYEPQGLYT